jgi:hypothetical protein
MKDKQIKETQGFPSARSDPPRGEVNFRKPREKSLIIIITHLLGLAPAEYLAAPDNGA